MKINRLLVLMAVLAVQPIGGFAASYVVSKPDPVGEKVYAAGLLRRMAPVGLIAGAFSLAWLLHKARGKADKLSPDNAGSHHG